MRPPFFWGNKKLHPIREQDQADFIVVSNCAEREQTCNLGGKFAFRLRGAPKIPRCANIDNQHDCKFTFLCEFLHERGPEPRGHIPVNRANIVARLIFAHILEIHSASLKHTVVIARERGLDQTLGLDLQRADFFKNLGRRLRASRSVIPSRAKRSRGIPLHCFQVHLTAHISETKSRHAGFDFAISASFLLRRQRFNCFSRAIALPGSGNASKWISLSALYCRAKWLRQLTPCSQRRRPKSFVTPM